MENLSGYNHKGLNMASPVLHGNSEKNMFTWDTRLADSALNMGTLVIKETSYNIKTAECDVMSFKGFARMSEVNMMLVKEGHCVEEI